MLHTHRIQYKCWHSPEQFRNMLKHFCAGEMHMLLDEFYSRVSAREGEDLPTSIFYARAVIRVLSEAVSPGEINDVFAQLPPEYDRFIQEAIEGPMPA